MGHNIKNATLQNDLAQLAELFNQQKLSECETLARQITKKHPQQGFAWKVLGAVLQKLMRVDESLYAKKKAVELLPQDAEAHNNLASTLASFNHHDEAVKHYRKAIHLNVNYIEAHYNLGISLEKLNNLTEAEGCYRQAIKLKPSHPEAHTNLALLLLRNGEFSEGWAEYQWSYHPQNTTPNQPKEPNLSATRWQGESLQGKIILIYSEQGLGDMIQFVRYSELLKSKGASVWVLANRALTTLFETVPWIDRVLTEGEQYTLRYDFWVFPFSLPFLLQTTLDTIPSIFPYVFANQEKSLWWQNWLEQRIPLGNKRVGLVWAGNPKHPNDAKRSIPLEQFSVLRALENVSWVSLQLGEKTHADIEKSDLNIIDASAFINDLSDTAALLTNLDLLITVDSAPAHLAGALNLPVWILITQVPDWRWLLMRNDSIWYESCLLFRQAQNSDWVSVLQDIKMSLKQLNISNENKMNQIISTEPAEHVLVELTQLYNQNDTETCEKLALKLVEQYPEHGFAWKVMGALLQKQGRIKESLSAKQKAAKLLPNDAEVHSNLGSAELLQGLFEEAEQSCRRALALNPLLVSAHNNLGLILQKLGQYSGAEECFRKVLDIGQKTSENFCNLGNALQAQDKFTEAEDNYQQALLLNADYLDAHNNLGVIFKKSGKLSRSEQSYRRVVELNPNDFDSHNNLGIILQEMNNLPEAEAAYQRALELAPNNANIHCNLGNIFLAKHQHQEAMQSYRNALISTPDNAYALSQCVYIDRMLCNWHSINEDNAKLLTYIEKKVASVLVPFGILATPIANAQHQKKSAELHADFRYKSKLEHVPYVKEKTYGHTKLRIGYLSADMHSHATVRLLAGVLENRNTQAFITHIYSYGPNKEDEGRSRMEAACEHFHEVSWLSDEAIAKQIVADEIDILVDLKGYTQDGRLGITALRPAPVIVSWLGYPGTLGHPKLADYIIGDPTVTPLEHAEDFSETLALMPHCYQPNDDKRELGAPPNRKDVGLPLTGFVFCSFNQPYKITPETFSVWCRLLVAVPDSVLWIMALFPDTQANLKAEVQKYDIDPNRLIFAPPMLLTSHLGRLQLADLALDTFPYTSHTTASDALWAGVPLVTKMGDTFASRVAASILNTMDLAELVTTNDEDYFNVALSLAQNHKKLAAIKQKIAEQKPLSPLFDTPKFARDLERLYLTIWEQELSGDRKAIYLESCEQAAGNPNYLKNKGDVKHKTRMVTAKKITKDLKQCNHIEQDKFSSLRKQFEYCPLCKSQRSTILLTSDSQSHALYNSSLPSDLIWLKCSDCYHVFTKYYWTPEGLSKIFYNVDERQIAGGNIDQKRQTWKPVIQNVLTVLGGYSILPTTPPYLTWLDIGCGDGSLVMIAAEFGFNATGLDARAQTVKALNDIGYQAIQGDFMSIEIDESPFVISMMDVLEHLQNPCEALQHIHSLLHPKGVLVISLPNSDSASWKLMDKNNPYWIEFEHYHNFSRQRLIELLNLYGFNVVHYDIPFRYKAQMELYAMKKIEW